MKYVICDNCKKRMKKIADEYSMGHKTYTDGVWRCFWCGNMKYGK